MIISKYFIIFIPPLFSTVIEIAEKINEVKLMYPRSRIERSSIVRDFENEGRTSKRVWLNH